MIQMMARAVADGLSSPWLRLEMLRSSLTLVTNSNQIKYIGRRKFHPLLPQLREGNRLRVKMNECWAEGRYAQTEIAYLVNELIQLYSE